MNAEIETATPPLASGRFPAPLPGWQERLRTTRLESRWSKLKARGIADEFGIERELNPDQAQVWRAELARHLRRGGLAMLALAAIEAWVVLHWQLSSLLLLSLAVLAPLGLLTRARRRGPIAARRDHLEFVEGFSAGLCQVLFAFSLATGAHSALLGAAAFGVACMTFLWLRRSNRFVGLIAYAEFDAPPEYTGGAVLDIAAHSALVLGFIGGLYAPVLLAQHAEPPRPMLTRALVLSGAAEAQVDAFLGEFRRAWNAGDFEALDALHKEGPRESKTWTEWKLEQDNPGRDAGAIGLPQLSEVPLAGDWYQVPQVSQVKLRIDLEGVEFEAALIASPAGVVWR